MNKNITITLQFVISRAPIDKFYLLIQFSITNAVVDIPRTVARILTLSFQNIHLNLTCFFLKKNVQHQVRARLVNTLVLKIPLQF